MVMRKTRRPRRKAAAKPRRKAVRKAVRKEDFARVVEIQETGLVAVNDALGQSVGAQMSFCLADYQRPQEVAHAYKYYRAAKCEITFIPYYNIAQTGGAAPTRMPQLYMSVDRVGNRWIAPTETECLERGISPRLFNKKHKLSFVPNLLQEIQLETRQPVDGGGTPLGIDIIGALNAVPLFNKWLPTQQSFGYANPNFPTGQQLVPQGVNPYALRYYGAIFNCSIEGPVNTSTEVGDIQVKITWEFKGPRSLVSNRPLAEPNPYANTSMTSGVVANTQPTTYP